MQNGRRTGNGEQANMERNGNERDRERTGTRRIREKRETQMNATKRYRQQNGTGQLETDENKTEHTETSHQKILIVLFYHMSQQGESY